MPCIASGSHRQRTISSSSTVRAWSCRISTQLRSPSISLNPSGTEITTGNNRQTTRRQNLRDNPFHTSLAKSRQTSAYLVLQVEKPRLMVFNFISFTTYSNARRLSETSSSRSFDLSKILHELFFPVFPPPIHRTRPLFPDRELTHLLKQIAAMPIG